jgi:hypothetical protein
MASFEYAPEDPRVILWTGVRNPIPVVDLRRLPAEVPGELKVIIRGRNSLLYDDTVFKRREGTFSFDSVEGTYVFQTTKQRHVLSPQQIALNLAVGDLALGEIEIPLEEEALREIDKGEDYAYERGFCGQPVDCMEIGIYTQRAAKRIKGAITV